MERIPKFNSLEEVKEFISSTDKNNVGAIHFIDEDGKSVQMPMDDFIEKVGLDNAAKFIYESGEHMTGIQTNSDEIMRIIEKFKKDPSSLTKEEKTILFLVMGGATADKIDTSEKVFSIMTKAFMEIGQDFTKHCDGFLAVMITYMENVFLINSDLAVHANNDVTYNEIIKNVTEQIVIPEGIDEASLFLGLLHIIGDRFVTNCKLTKDMAIDYHKVAELFGLDMEFLFGENDENNNDAFMNKDIETYKKEIMPDVKDFINAEKAEKAKANTVKPDVRKILKESKK